MIQFRESQAPTTPRAGDGSGTAVIGIGRAGVHIVDQIILEKCGPRCLIAVDTDEQDIRASVALHKHLLGRSTLRGLGTGGDSDLAARLAHQDAPALAELTKGLRTAILVTGLGGGTGTGATPVLARQLQDTGVSVFVMACLPFHFEGQRVQRARNGLHHLSEACTGLLALSSDRLLHLPETRQDIRHAFHQANVLVARGSQCLLHLLDSLGTSPLSATELGQLFGHPRRENAWLATACASGPDRVDRVVAQLLASPYFHDATIWSQTRMGALTLAGGPDMPIAETQEFLIRLRQALPVELTIRHTTHVGEHLHGTLSATLIVTDPAIGDHASQPAPAATASDASTPTAAPLPPPVATPAHGSNESDSEEKLAQEDARARSHRRKSTPQRYFTNKQEEFTLDDKSNRGRFEKSAPTIIDGEDLDIPTFQRRGLKIKI